MFYKSEKTSEGIAIKGAVLFRKNDQGWAPEVQDKMFVDRHRETGVYLEPNRTPMMELFLAKIGNG